MHKTKVGTISALVIVEAFLVGCQLTGESLQSEIEERGQYWRQHPHINFCGNKRYAQTEETCADLGLEFDASRCKCLNDPRARPVRPTEVFAKTRSFKMFQATEQPRCLYNTEDHQLNVDAYTEDAARLEYRLPEFSRCSLQLGPVSIPQPADNQMSYQPQFVVGPVCVGLPDSSGRKCVAKDTFLQKVEVEPLNMLTSRILDATFIEIRMPKSCYMAKGAVSCNHPSKVADATGICRCNSVKTCHGNEVWSDDTCACTAAPPRPPREVITDEVHVFVTEPPTSPPTTTIEVTPSPLFSKPESKIVAELKCLRQDGCSFGFGRVFDRSTSECYCSCHVENLIPKALCKAMMKVVNLSKGM